MDQAAVRLQLRLAGAFGADGALAAAALALQMGPHAGQPRQQIPVLGQLYLEPSLLGLGPLGKDIQDQPAAVQHLYAQQVRQNTLLGRGEVIVEDHHGHAMGLTEHPHFLYLSLSDEGARIRGRAVLQDAAYRFASSRLHQGSKLLHGALIGIFLLLQHRGVQSYQHHPVAESLPFLA